MSFLHWQTIRQCVSPAQGHGKDLSVGCASMDNVFPCVRCSSKVGDIVQAEKLHRRDAGEKVSYRFAITEFGSFQPLRLSVPICAESGGLWYGAFGWIEGL